MTPARARSDSTYTPLARVRSAARRIAGARRGHLLALAVGVTTLGASAVAVAEGPADFSISDETPAPGQLVSFEAVDACEPAETCSWSTDGVTGTGKHFSTSYTDVGPHTVTLTVDDGDPESGAPVTVDKEITVTVNQAPHAAITGPATAVINQAVTFDSTGSFDPDGLPLAFAWELGGADPADFLDGTASSVTHTFTELGPQIVQLQVTDAVGEPATVSHGVLVTNALPVGSISASSTSPFTGDPVTFTASASDPDGGAASYAWDLDGDDSFDDASGPTVGPFQFSTPGPVTARVMISDDELGTVIESVVVQVQNRPPLVNFSWAPDVVVRGKAVTFTSEAIDPEGRGLALEAWDLDGDGEYDDAFGSTAVHTFNKAGTHVVGLSVVDADGAGATSRISVVSGNRSPQASFTASPERVTSGGTVKLTSTSSDSDGGLVEQRWDLDGDGDFDDATGATAERRFDAPGKASVSLKVIDDDGGSDVAFREIEVLAPGQQAQAPARVRMLDPFPLVRIAGRLSGRGASFRLVSVTAPRGARISASCRGGGCRSGRKAVVAREVRLKHLQGSYRAGAVIEVRVTKRGWIGKYTRIVVRRGKPPARRDLCLFPGSSRPRTCPAS